MSRAHRILLIDDNQSILEDFKLILGEEEAEISAIGEKLEQLKLLRESGEVETRRENFAVYQVDVASSGRQGLEMAKASIEEGYPYSVVFVDFRMPPGWNGVETIKKMRMAGLGAEYVICSAYSDYSWEKMTDELGVGDDLLFLSKPFMIVEVKQMALSLTRKVSIKKERQRVLGQLKKSLKSAEEGARVKNHFLSVVNHELRTPLNAIVGFSQLLSSRLASDNESTEFIDRIKGAASDLMGIVDKMLNYVDLKSNRFPVRPTSFGVGALISELVESARVSYSNNENKISYHIAEGVEEFVTDSILLRQALEQVISNACKFTQMGTVEVRVSEGVGVSGFKTLEFVVSDSGVGVNPASLTEIFDSFYQQDSSSSRKFGGLGLGLALVKDFIYLLGGEVRVQSQPNKGTEVFIWVPELETDTSQIKKIPQESLLIHKNGNLDLSPLNILVVEDSEGNRELVREYYSGVHGAHLIFAENGDQALRVYRTESIDLVLLDIGLPDMDGLEVVRRMREIKLNKSVPVIAVTGFAGEDFFDHAILAGCDDVVTKPFSFDELDRKIKKYLPAGSESSFAGFR